MGPRRAYMGRRGRPARGFTAWDALPGSHCTRGDAFLMPAARSEAAHPLPDEQAAATRASSTAQEAKEARTANKTENVKNRPARPRRSARIKRNLAYRRKASSRASMDRYAQDNRANQRNTNHTATGSGRPSGYQGSKTNENNRANQLNPNHPSYKGKKNKKGRGVGEEA